MNGNHGIVKETLDSEREWQEPQNQVRHRELRSIHSQKDNAHFIYKKKHNSILNELKELKQEYVSNGGCNPRILEEIQLLENEGGTLLQARFF